MKDVYSREFPDVCEYARVCVCVCVCVYVCTRERVLGQTGIWSALHVLLTLLETENYC